MQFSLLCIPDDAVEFNVAAILLFLNDKYRLYSVVFSVSARVLNDTETLQSNS
ncbi:protein of unknown function [Candidatus Filomicrobium marinum]|nr:protein of unknown function [Candidatus Filomicrobium marinum]